MRRNLDGYGLPSVRESDSITDMLLRASANANANANGNTRRATNTASTAALLPPAWMATTAAAAAVAAASVTATSGNEQHRLGVLAGRNAARAATTTSRLPVQDTVIGRLGLAATTGEQYPWILNRNKASSNSAFISTENNVHTKSTTAAAAAAAAGTAAANPLKKRGIGQLLSPTMTVAGMKNKTSKRQRKTSSPGSGISNSSNNKNSSDMMERLASMGGGFPMPKKWAAAFNSNSQKQHQQKKKKKEKKKRNGSDSGSGCDLITWRDEAESAKKGGDDDRRVTVPLSIGAFPMPRRTTTTPAATSMVGPDSFHYFQQIWDDAIEETKKNEWYDNSDDDLSFLWDLQKEVLRRQFRQQLG
eukprot:CAMPEP_0113483106 /NCGR_PEP_ID=MMETSP0014_2-20120614/23263_1 /TAXON_ID=2857 /ORGANISM="Nitzschia sp." /LENGTH=360 /DNA_ID=CAMNT_0000376643 /DNA_START=296 /DNA_END=1378 /DNA_ORIENTATION=- /assembly_acc=CAM_ASM_000159